MPFVIRNTLRSGRLSGPSSAGPAVLALGNNPEAPAGYLVYPETYTRWFELEDKQSVIQDIVEWAKNEPGAFLEIQFRKFLLFWDAREIPNNISLEANGKLASFLKVAGFIPTSVLLFLSISAFLLMLKECLRHKGILLLMLFILFYAGAASVFYILARFRVSALGLFCILGAFTPDLIWRCIMQPWKRKGRSDIPENSGWKRWIRVCCACAVSGWIVFGAYDFYRSYYEAPVMRLLRPGGVQVEFPAGAGLLALDNGPQALGGWQLVPWKNGGKLVKYFELKKENWKKDGKLELELELYCPVPGTAAFLVNGKRYILELVPQEKSGLCKAVFSDLVFPEDQEFHVTLIQSRIPEMSFIVDLQRHYSRTSWEVEVLPGEAVCRLRLLPENSES